MKHVEAASIIRDAKPSWKSGIVLVCRECDGSPRRLRRALKDAVRDVGARKRVRVVGCDCLDICPKRATVVVTAGSGGTHCAIVRDGAIAADDLRPLVDRFEIATAGNAALIDRQE